jgi:hypothetical protein
LAAFSLPTTLSYDFCLLEGVKRGGKEPGLFYSYGNGQNLIAFCNTIVKLGQKEYRQRSKYQWF